MFSLFKWQKINFQTSQFNHFAFCCKSMTYGGHNVAKVFFFTCPTNPIWVWVQRIPSFFLSYCKQKFYHHFCKAWGFMLQSQGNMPWWALKVYPKVIIFLFTIIKYTCPRETNCKTIESFKRVNKSNTDKNCCQSSRSLQL